jgi:hypothetical protein
MTAIRTHANLSIVVGSSFGYRTIVVEQPLRGQWEVGSDTWDGLEDDSVLASSATTTVPPSSRRCARWIRRLTDNRVTFIADMASASGPSMRDDPRLFGLTPAQIRKLLARAFVRDPNADVVTNTTGHWVPDPERRDTEGVA